MMTKVSDFVMIPELKAIIIGGGSEENHLKLYQVYINEKTYLLDVKVHQKIKKESNGKVVQLNYSASKKLLSCLCNNGSQSGNTLEFYKVIIDN